MRRLLVTIKGEGRVCGECQHLDVATENAAWCTIFSVGIVRTQPGFERVTGCLNAERLADGPSMPPEGSAAA